MLPGNFIPILKDIVGASKRLDLQWALTGSLNLFLWGFDLQPNDIDLEMDKVSARNFDHYFHQRVTWEMHLRESERIRSWFGRYDFDGIQVEVMGDRQYRQPGGDWVSQVPLRERIHWITWQGLLLPLLDLRTENESCRWMGRLEKADRIRQWIELHPEYDKEKPNDNE